jgi:hypothetical protein
MPPVINLYLDADTRLFMKFIFSKVYRVNQKDFYAHFYTSMWAPVVARQISKHITESVELITPHMLINT